MPVGLQIIELPWREDLVRGCLASRSAACKILATSPFTGCAVQGGNMVARSAGRGSALRPFVLIAAALLVAAMLAPSASAASSSSAKTPKGALKPIPATGMGTAAAMNNPLCNTGSSFGAYGNWSTSIVGNGPPCVVPMKAGAKNSGASAQGVTATAIKVVFVMPNLVAQNAAGASAAGNPTNLNGNTKGTYENGAHDFLTTLLPFYETWGRGINVINYTSTGSDEAAQRADAVAILAMKPFAVINVDTAGLDVLEASIAKGKTLVFGYGTSPEEATAQAPYRWGAQDSDVVGLITAELVGKQLAGKKAEFAGDALKSTPRKFGLVNVEGFKPENGLVKELAKYKVKLATSDEYPGTGATFGDPAVSAQQAPTIVGKMKDAGVTSVILFSDVAMNKALTEEATKQQWFPEWILGGYPQFVDIPSLAQAYDRQQVPHMFGLSNFAPYVQLTPEQQALAINPNYTWMWGPQTGTTSARTSAGTAWLLNGIHAAGPDLTIKNFQHGLFSMPPVGGSATGNPLSGLTGYGKTPGLPYDSYTSSPLEFAMIWMDPTHDGQNTATSVTKGQSSWYVNGGQRYGYGNIPKQKLGFFDQTKSQLTLASYPAGVQPPTAAAPCPQGACPITGGTSPQPGSPSDNYTLDGWNGRTPNPA